MPPGLSIVVPVFGEEDRLVRCLAALVRAVATLPEGEAEILVADDGTPGGLSPELAERFPGVRWLPPSDRLGFGGNMNRGVLAARGGIVCLMNSDMYVAPDFFHDWERPFDDPSLFAVCGRIREPGGVNAGLKHLEVSPRGARVRFAADADPASEKPAPVAYPNGGGALVRRDRFLALGGFDPVFHPFYWEDTDLGYRAWKRGERVLYDPTRVLEHDHQGTIGREKRRRVSRVKARNQRLFLWRNWTDRSLAGLVLVGTLPVLLADLLRLRLRRVGWALADLPLLVHARRHRARERPALRRSDAEVLRLLAGAA
ncbi:MAG: glycosyltransferase family 2 protein [Myxococcota bacterium]